MRVSKKIKYLSDIMIHKTSIINNTPISKGNHIIISPFVYISTQIELGNYIHISSFTSIIGGNESKVKIGDFVGISCGCRIICGSDNYENSLGLFDTEHINKEVIFEGFNLIGTNSIIMPGVTMAIGSACCAGSVITKNTDEWTLYAGNGIAIKLRDKETILKKAKKYDIQ